MLKYSAWSHHARTLPNGISQNPVGVNSFASDSCLVDSEGGLRKRARVSGGNDSPMTSVYGMKYSCPG